MSKGVNKVLLLGAVGKDPEIRATASGSVVASFSLATSDRAKSQDGQWHDTTEWHNLVAFAKTAEVVRDYVKKGTPLFIEGKITTRSWDDKTSGEKKYKTEVIVNELTLIGSKSDSPENGQKPAGRSAAAPTTRTQAAPVSRAVTNADPFADTEITDDDLPNF